MNMEDLQAQKNEIEQTYNNLSNPQWVANELKHLQGKFDILTQVINKLEEENNATNQPEKQSA